MSSVFDGLLDQNRQKFDSLLSGKGRAPARTGLSPISPSAQPAPTRRGSGERQNGTVGGVPFSFAADE
jgi:hypothetical protein